MNQLRKSCRESRNAHNEQSSPFYVTWTLSFGPGQEEQNIVVVYQVDVELALEM